MNRLKQIHAHALRNGIDQSEFLVVKLLQIPNIPYAHSLFDLIPKPSLYLFNKLIQTYSSSGPPHQCFSLYSRMRLQGFTPNQYTFTFLFAACGSLSSCHQGQKLHAQFVVLGFKSDRFAFTALLDMYAKFGHLSSAHCLFDEMQNRDVAAWNSMITSYARWGEMERARDLFELMPMRNVISWTAMVSGYSQNGQYEKALAMFLRMEKEKQARPNELTLSSVLPACANLGALEVGERVEAYAREYGFFRNLFVSNALLEMYAKCGRIDTAMRVFKEIGSRRDLCSWNSMIMGLSLHGKWQESLDLFYEMLAGGTLPDDITFLGFLLACTHGGLIVQGQQLFGSMERDFSVTPKLEHYGCMVDLLGRAGELDEAHTLINNMPMKPDSVVWGALLAACSSHGHVKLAERAAESLFKLEPWNPGNYIILSNIYASAGKWDGVAKLRKLMKANQITKAAGYSFIEEGGHIHKFIVEDRSHPRTNEIYAMLDAVTIRLKLHSYVLDSDSEAEYFA